LLRPFASSLRKEKKQTLFSLVVLDFSTLCWMLRASTFGGVHFPIPFIHELSVKQRQQQDQSKDNTFFFVQLLPQWLQSSPVDQFVKLLHAEMSFGLGVGRRDEEFCWRSFSCCLHAEN